MNGNIDAVDGNLGPVNGNLGVMKKQQFAVIIGKSFFFLPKNSNLLDFFLLCVYWLRFMGEVLFALKN